jgi:hypothetical protein
VAQPQHQHGVAASTGTAAEVLRTMNERTPYEASVAFASQFKLGVVGQPQPCVAPFFAAAALENADWFAQNTPTTLLASAKTAPMRAAARTCFAMLEKALATPMAAAMHAPSRTY